MSMEKILLIEQDKTQCEELKTLLTEQGFKVFTTDKSTRAMSMVDNDNIALVIFCYSTEDQNRLRFLEHTRKKSKTIKIIMLSEEMNEAILTEVKGLIDSAILKPFDSEKLIQTVAKVLPRKRRESSLNKIDKKVFSSN